MSEKLCPLINLQPCIGEKCAMHIPLECYSNVDLGNNKMVDLEYKLENAPVVACALVWSGMANAVNHVANNISSQAKNHLK